MATEGASARATEGTSGANAHGNPMRNVARAINGTGGDARDRRGRAFTACALAAAVALGLAAIPWDSGRFEEFRQDFPRTGPRDGSLPAVSARGVRGGAADSTPIRSQPVNNKNALATSLALTIASGAAAAPPGWVLVADSEAQFSGTQGQDGWWYLFDQGEATAVGQLPHYVPFANGLVWCSGGVAGNGGSHCIISRAACHPNTASNCNTPAAGNRRPLREWRSSHPLRAIVHIIATPIPISPGMRLDVLADREAVQSWESFSGSAGVIDASIDVGFVTAVGLLQDPLGSCHMDSLDNVLRIYTPDCDGNGSADYLEIATSPGLDADGNLVLDSCECLTHPELPACCPADLTRDGQVNGADIGAVVAFWGPNPAFPAADINGDGTVNGSDLATVLASWGPCGG